MGQKAKRRTSPAPIAKSVSNGNGFHKDGSWLLGDPIPNHPLASIAGSYKDDPFWDEFVQAMADARREEEERFLKDREDD